MITLNDRQKELLEILKRDDIGEINERKNEIADFLYEIYAKYFEIARKLNVDKELKLNYTYCSTYTTFGGINGDNYMVDCQYHEDRYEWDDYVLIIPKSWILEMTKSLELWESHCIKIKICDLKSKVDKLNSELNSVYDEINKYNKQLDEIRKNYEYK